MSEIVIDVAKDYTDVPNARYIADGDFSGQDFREKFLEQYFVSKNNEKIKLILDGTMGYATSFLEESFGGLVRKFGNLYTNKEIFEKFNFVSDEEPACIAEIKRYIYEAKYENR